MRLIRARIENFGKLSDVTFDFAENCQIFCEENGWGKSTLAAFLCVMFYGFDGEKKRDELANERKRYAPWQKGVYGGRITFAVGDKTYEMARTFGKKEVQDEFSLRMSDTNLESMDYSKNIGEELFHIDRESFRRTIFLSQQDCETYATDAVNAKIGNLIHHTDDVNNFASAYSRLKDITNRMRPNHKKGSLKQLKEEMGELENEIRYEDTLAKRMEETSSLRMEQVEKWKGLQEEILHMEKKQQVLSGNLDLQSKRTEYKALCEAWEEEKLGREEIARRFLKPDCIPEQGDLEEYLEQEKRCRELAGYVKQNTLSEEEWRQFKAIQARWGELLPSEEQMTEMERANQRLVKLRRELASYKLSTEEDRCLQELEEKYLGHVPEPETVEGLRRDLQEAKRKEEGLPAKRATVKTLTQMMQEKQTNKVSPLRIIGLLVLFLGVGGMVFHSAVWLVAVLAGIVCLVLSFVLEKKTLATEAESEELKELRQQVEEEQQLVQTTYARVAQYLAKYVGDLEQSRMEQCLEEIVRDVTKYVALSQKRGAARQQEEGQVGEQLAASIKQFLQRYAEEVQEEENWATQLAKIRSDCERMKQWGKKKEDYSRAKTAYREQVAELQDYLSSLGYDDKGTDAERTLRQVLNNVRDYESANIRYQRAVERKQKFEKAHNMEKLLENDAQEVENESIAKLTEQIRLARENQKVTEQLIRDYEKRLADDQEQWDGLQELKVELADKKERYEDGFRKYQLLCKTMELLQVAKDRLTARYLEPVKNGFDKYYRMMSGMSAENYRFDAGVKLTVMEKGLQRETKFLSEGYRDLLGICTRLALVDAMYQGEKPFLILDDPFVNLDEEKTEGALRFLKSVSEEYQVVYFTCHESRVSEV